MCIFYVNPGIKIQTPECITYVSVVNKETYWIQFMAEGNYGFKLDFFKKKYIKSDYTEVFESKVFKKIQVERAVNAGTT